MAPSTVGIVLALALSLSVALGIPTRPHRAEGVAAGEFVLESESWAAPKGTTPRADHPVWAWARASGLYEVHAEGFASLGRAWLEEEEQALLRAATGGSRRSGDSPLPGPYYAFVPKFQGKVLPAAGAGEEAPAPGGWDSPCFSVNKASATAPDATGGFDVVIEAASPHGGMLCGDSYLLASTTTWKVVLVSKAGKTTVRWGGPGEDAEDLAEYGVRVFRFTQSIAATMESLHQTGLLFYSALKSVSVPDSAAKRNLDFLSTYAHIDMPARPITDVAVDESLIQSGDMFGIVRLDGLDPLIMWGTGSHLGHTAVALRIDGTLYVCESQDKTSYWPKAHVQKTEFSEWLALAKKADYGVVWLPLGKQARASFDEAAAAAAFHAYEGLPYGFPNLLWGWIDGADGNMPDPLHEQLLMVALALGDPVLTKGGRASVANQAFAQRLRMPNIATATTRETYAEARKQGLTFAQLIAMPEKDKWVYPGGVDASGPYPPGRAMVCNVFVCTMWKAAGIINATVECSEFTPYDTYELAVFNTDPAARPAACKAADPSSPFCQLLGKYAISLPRWGTSAPFDHMREKCPATPPDYEDRAALAGSC